MNPVKKVRKNKNLSLNQFAQLIGSNEITMKNVEKGNCLGSTYLTIIKKMSLKFDDIDDGNLVKEYENWLQENDITVK